MRCDWAQDQEVGWEREQNCDSGFQKNRLQFIELIARQNILGDMMGKSVKGIRRYFKENLLRAQEQAHPVVEENQAFQQKIHLVEQGAA